MDDVKELVRTLHLIAEGERQHEQQAERVARAICSVKGPEYECNWEQYTHEAEAAIRAMNEVP